MSVSGARDLTFPRGDSYEHRIEFLDQDGTTPLDLTGAVFAAQLRRSPNDDVFVAFAVDNSEVAAGVVTISLTKAQTAALGRNYSWDLEATLAGKVTTWLAGNVAVVLDSTRAA